MSILTLNFTEIFWSHKRHILHHQNWCPLSLGNTKSTVWALLSHWPGSHCTFCPIDWHSYASECKFGFDLRVSCHNNVGYKTHRITPVLHNHSFENEKPYWKEFRFVKFTLRSALLSKMLKEISQWLKKEHCIGLLHKANKMKHNVTFGSENE